MVVIKASMAIKSITAIIAIMAIMAAKTITVNVVIKAMIGHHSYYNYYGLCSLKINSNCFIQ